MGLAISAPRPAGSAKDPDFAHGRCAAADAGATSANGAEVHGTDGGVARVPVLFGS